MSKKKQSAIDELHKTGAENSPQDGADSFEPADRTGKQSKKDAADTQKLTEELNKVKAEFAELDDQNKRLLADYQNLSKRVTRERVESQKYAAVSAVESLLPALDNFDYAKKSVGEDLKQEDVVKSIDMLKDQLITCLKSVGLEIIDTTIPFNPEFHEAISNLKDPSKEEGTIIEVVKTGYKIKDRVIRPAMVVVSTKE